MGNSLSMSQRFANKLCFPLGISAHGSTNNSTQPFQARPRPLSRWGYSSNRNRSHTRGTVCHHGPHYKVLPPDTGKPYVMCLYCDIVTGDEQYFISHRVLQRCLEAGQHSRGGYSLYRQQSLLHWPAWDRPALLQVRYTCVIATVYVMSGYVPYVTQ